MRLGLVRELPSACKLTHKSDSVPPKDWQEALDRVNGSQYLVQINSRGSINGQECWEVQIKDGNKDLYRWRSRKYEDDGGIEAAALEVYYDWSRAEHKTFMLTDEGAGILARHLLGQCRCEEPLKQDKQWGEVWECVNDLNFHDLVAHAIEGRLKAAAVAAKVNGKKVATAEA